MNKSFFQFFLVIFTYTSSSGQPEVGITIPIDLKNFQIALIHYNFQDWQNRYIDSTNNHWITSHYRKEDLYRSYQISFEKILKIFKRHKIDFNVIEKNSEISKDHKYILDFKQVMVSNEESKVAFNHLGGFYFRDIKAGVSFKPMIENKRFIANTIRKGLKKT